MSADLEESMEFVEPEAAGPAEESGDEAVTDEETDLGMDWETVPSPRFCDIPSQVETPVSDRCVELEQVYVSDMTSPDVWSWWRFCL